MKIIRSGATRTVILIGAYAVKVPSLRGVHPGGVRGRLAGVARGLLANISEHIWHDYEPWRGQVAPVLHSWLFGLIQIYPRCEPLDLVDDDDGRAQLPELDPDPCDLKVENFGLLDGRIVRVDYEMD